MQLLNWPLAEGVPAMHLTLHEEDIQNLVREIVSQTLSSIDWPVGRVALTELEAAQAVGVARHVLRDLRLRGQIRARRLGKRIVYTRNDLLNALDGAADQRGRRSRTKA